MANLAILFNTPTLTNDTDTLCDEMNEAQDWSMNCGEARYRIPVPWLCLFESSDLKPATIQLLDANGEAFTANIQIPCAALSKSQEMLRNSLWIYEAVCQDTRIAKDYWQAAMRSFSLLSRPYLTIRPVEILFMENDIEEASALFAQSLTRDESAIEKIIYWSQYDARYPAFDYEEFMNGRNEYHVARSDSSRALLDCLNT